MKTKPDKVEEPTAPYTTKKAVAQPEAGPQQAGGMKQANLEAIRRQNAELMQVHRKVLQKLAQ